MKIACPRCGGRSRAITDVGNPWLDAGIVPFSTMHYREDPEYWEQWFPADFVTESFPGQFRNWFYAMLAMSTVLRREAPFKTIFGYAPLFGEDGRQMHKSWGNAIEFDEAAERMGVDVMRWMFATARPDDNILFGWHAADEARRELLVLWNVYAFFVTYARLAGWTRHRARRLSRTGRPWTAGSCRARPASRRRWRSACTMSTPWVPPARSASTSTTCPPGTCGSRAGACPGRRARPGRRVRHAPRGARRLARMLAPILPFLSDSMYENLVVDDDPAAPTASTSRAGRRPSWRRTATRRWRRQWPSPSVPSTSPGRCAGTGPPDPPAARPAWLALPDRDLAELDALLRLVPDEINVKVVEDRRRVRPRGAAGQGPAPAGRQAPGCGDPGGHGRRPRRSLRVPRTAPSRSPA